MNSVIKQRVSICKKQVLWFEKNSEKYYIHPDSFWKCKKPPQVIAPNEDIEAK